MKKSYFKFILAVKLEESVISVDVFAAIAVAMVAGLLMTRLTNIFRMPDVTAYLLAGICVGPFVLGRLGISGLGFTSYEEVESLDMLSNLALGFIAFAIGNEFVLPRLKSIGRQAVIVAIFQALTAVIFVTAALIIVYFIAPDKMSLPVAITLGAVASATAPAATLLVIRQYKAEGPVTDILLPVVALDDAVGLVCFAVAIGVAKALIGGHIDFVSIAVEPLLEIIISLVFGAFMGYVLTKVETIYHSNQNRIILIISFVIFTVAISLLRFNIFGLNFGLSTLLVCMMLGTVFCNLCPRADDLMARAERWTAPLYCLFFVMSGAALRLDVFSDIAMVIIGMVYVIARAAGKIVGADISAKATHCHPMVQKYLGYTLLPQAGVALGMSLTAAAQLGAEGATIRSLVLFGVLIYELVGPTITKIALTKSGDIHEKYIA